MTQPMPKVDPKILATQIISDETLELAGMFHLIEKVVHPKSALVRATQKPPTRTDSGFDQTEAEAFYVWRMLVFFVSPNQIHHHMPYGADVYLLMNDFNSRAERCRSLDKLVDALINSIPSAEHHGLKLWRDLLIS